VDEKGCQKEMEWFKTFYVNSRDKMPPTLAALERGRDDPRFLNAQCIMYNNLEATKHNWELELEVYNHFIFTPNYLSVYLLLNLQPRPTLIIWPIMVAWWCSFTGVYCFKRRCS
jgi:hypothetical protein